MPFFKTTKNILIDGGEYFDPNWMDSDSLVLPPKEQWTYDRNMQIEDVDLWEVIYEAGFAVYAAWSPYAEFYLVIDLQTKAGLEAFYGPGAIDQVLARAKQRGITLPLHEHWVEPDQMWLYHK
jgi:hypothetical protein